jgi:hypothetical protein
VLRESWQRLGGVAAQYLVRAEDDELLVTDAAAIGSEIASRTVSAGGTVVHAVTDYLHFRAGLLPIALSSSSGEGHGAACDVPRFDRLMGEALLAIVEGFPASPDR